MWRTEKISIALDPMKSDAGGWLAGKLTAEPKPYEVANRAATAAAMTAVATQPRTLTHPFTANSPMTFGAAASHIMIAMTGTATTPLITALQYSARIGSIGVKFMIMPTIVAMQMTA